MPCSELCSWLSRRFGGGKFRRDGAVYAIRISRSCAPHFVHVSPMLELAISAPYATTNRAVLSRVDLSRVQTTQMAWPSPRSASPLGHLGRDASRWRLLLRTVVPGVERSPFNSNACVLLAQSELPLERTNDRGGHSRHAENDFVGRGCQKALFVLTSTSRRTGGTDSAMGLLFLLLHAQRRADTTSMRSKPMGQHEDTNPTSHPRVARARRTASRVSRQRVTVRACGSASPTPPETSQVKQSVKRRRSTALDRAPRQGRPTPSMTPPTRSRAQATKA